MSRGIRGFVDGAVAVALSAYLELLGWSGARIGVVVTGMLLGSAALTLLVGVRLGGVPRRTILRWGAVTMVVCGLVYASTTVFVVLLVVGVIGTMNPSSGDVSVFSPVEQSLVPSTVADADRTRLFARYTFTGTLAAALGSLVVGVPEWVADRTSIGETAALRSVFGAYALAGVVVWVVFRRLSPAVEPHATAPPTPLGPSRPMVHRLALVFAVDSFGGGFVVQSLLALWLFRHFDLSTGAAGALLFWMGLCSAVSMFASPRLAARIGLVRTMAFTHMPAQVFLILAAVAPSLPLAVVFLTLRSLLAAMDVPARNSYVMAVVTPAERAAAASVTQVPRSLAAAVPPLFAGWLLDQSSFGWPLVIGGVLKLVYDVTLLSMFRHVRPPEEAGSLSR
ncbi:MAG: MFS transporter [Acidimicrobiales bacterium]|nr:MFS transporter [Acidimicrobiales bacterium]